MLGENLLVTFLGWEGVGTCSYLLIGFWYTERRGTPTAGKKAFVTNRIGDWGFMLAMFLGFEAVGSVSYLDSRTVAAESRCARRDARPPAIALLLFVGAVGKSAQLPLYVWLPDAMAGPTPVSALIHAATMVTAGVYLVARMNPLLAAAAPEACAIIAWVGAITALFAATIAIAQTDIKKVLAYSTVSQLGYMFLAVGSGAYVAAIFHLVTHAFFKALLFLGAGSVIHGMHHEQDMRKMGGLRKDMPVTAATFIIGWLAIAGVPPFAGLLLEGRDPAVHAAPSVAPVLYAIGLVTAVLTAFYMTRQVIMVFFGEARWESHANEAEAPEGEEDHAPRRPRRVQAARVVADHAVPARRAGRPGGGRRHHPAAVVRLHPVRLASQARRLAAPDRRRPARPRSPSTSAYDAKGLARAARDRLCRSPASPPPSRSTPRRWPSRSSREILADGWRYDPAISAFMGGPGRKAFEAIAWFDKNIVDGAVNGAATTISQECRRHPARSDRQRPELRAASSASEWCCCSSGS